MIILCTHFDSDSVVCTHFDCEGDCRTGWSVWSFSNGDRSKNATFKMNSRVFKLCRVYSSSLKLSAVGEFPRSRLLGNALKFRKRKRKRMKILPCSTNQVLFWRPRCRCCRRCYSSLPAVNDSPTQDYAHRDDHILSPYVIFLHRRSYNWLLVHQKIVV